MEPSGYSLAFNQMFDVGENAVTRIPDRRKYALPDNLNSHSMRRRLILF